MSDLPDGWVKCEIGEVTKVVSGGTPPSKDSSNFTKEGGISWITPSDLSGYKEAYISHGTRNLTQKGYDSSSAIKIPKGSVLFSSRAPVGYVAIASNEVTTNQGFKSFILPESIDCRFVYFYLRYIKPLAESMSTGTTFKELSGAAAARLPFILAPLNEQKRIAEKLDTLLAQVDACRDRLDRIPRILKHFRQSVLAAATSGDLTEDWRIECSKALQVPMNSEKLDDLRRARITKHRRFNRPIHASEIESTEFSDLPESWYRATLDQITWSVKDGPHFSPKYVEEGIPFISGGSIRPEGIDFSIAKFISPDLHAELSARCKPELNDILYTKGGTTCIARVNTESIDFNVWVHVAVLKLVSFNISNPFFVQHVLNSPQGYAQSQRYTHGVGNQDLGLTRMIKIVIPLPPIEEQQEIVRRVESLFAYADTLESRYQTARAQVEKLTPALLAKAFRGELVPQDPNDEPASVLLERIRSQRAQQPTKTRKSSPREKQTTLQKPLYSSNGSVPQSNPQETFQQIELLNLVNSAEVGSG